MNKKLILTSEGIKVIDAPEKLDFRDSESELRYEESLEKAIKEGVLFKPEHTNDIISKLFDAEILTCGDEMELNELYDIPEYYSVKIENNYAYLIPNE